MLRYSSYLLLLPLFFAPVRAELKPQPGEQIATSVTVTSQDDQAETVDVPLLLYAPENYAEAAPKLPLMLFLHGLGESGDGGEDLELVKLYGPPKLVDAGRKLPFVIASPQSPRPNTMEKVRRAWRPEVLLPLLDRLESELRVDPTRVYVTGFSMGGYGTWRLAAAAPERFAAAAPICGGGDPATMAEPLAKVPIWAFHGGADNVVPVEGSIRLVEAIQAVGGDARLTIYPEARHNSWTATYDNPMFYDWLLGLKRERGE